MAGSATGADEPASYVGQELLSRGFDSTGVTELRHIVTELASAAGLTGQRRDDFILAVNELVTNAVRHGGGTGQVRLWCVDGNLICEVIDRGTGLPADHPIGQRRPPAEVAGGWGLWLARRLSDTFSVSTGPSGTTIRIQARISAAA